MPAVIAERQRLQIIDLIRGIAVVAMIVYHLSWDLLDYGLINIDVVNDPLWRGFAHAIAGTFLGLVGFNLVLANRRGIRTVPYFRRLGLLAGGAALVSLGTWLFVPEAFVFFGVLHMILVASVLGLPFLRAPIAVTIVVAVFCFAAPSLFTSELFDTKLLLWPGLLLGLSKHLVETVDYVPILPWFGVVLAGIAAGRFILRDGGESLLARWRFSAGAWRPILFVGRWSLPIYLIHQPILIGIVSLLMPFIGPSEEALAARFLNQCKTSCQTSGETPATCQSTCECAATGATGAGLLAHLMAGRMSYAEDRSWQGIVEQCLPKQQPPLTKG
jgi:uncharacterized membrane protein